MKLFTRIICLLLVCCFVGMTMIGCKKDKQNENANENNGNASGGPTEKVTNEYGEESFTTVVPSQDLDFGGEELTILIRDNVQNSREWTKEATEDELDEAIAMRNSAVADTLNVEIVFELIPSPDHATYIQNLNSMITTDVDSDMHYYDIGCNFSYYCTSSILRGYSANLLDTVTFPCCKKICGNSIIKHIESICITELNKFKIMVVIKELDALLLALFTDHLDIGNSLLPVRCAGAILLAKIRNCDIFAADRNIISNSLFCCLNKLNERNMSGNGNKTDLLAHFLHISGIVAIKTCELNAINKGSHSAHGKLWHNVGRFLYVPCALILCLVALLMKIPF